MTSASPDRAKQLLVRLLIKAYALYGISLAIYFFLIPGDIVAYDVATTPSGPAIPAPAWRLFHALTPKYEQWALKRIASHRAEQLSKDNVASTEWPLFGSVFYLWGVEALQDAWQADHSLSPRAPVAEARGAIEAATNLVVDPGHAGWVKQYWGDRYLTHQDLFYRMLLISALTTHARLTGTGDVTFLRGQVESLSTELAQSPAGLLDDYPGQCYPGDVISAIAAIHDADGVLGTDHSAFFTQARRGFQPSQLDDLGLVTYMSDSNTGKPLGPARGCGNSYVSLRAPLVWPDLAADWYARYRSHFWQRKWTADGFREFSRETRGGDWYADVDSGPVMAGHGVAATAFGVGAARANGRFDDAYPLALETFVTSWPLPNGTLTLPRMLSNATDAPYLGEAAILYFLSRPPAPGVTSRTGGSIPPFVFIVLSFYFLAGALVTIAMGQQVRARLRRIEGRYIPRLGIQATVWFVLLCTVPFMFAAGHASIALVELLIAGWIPIGVKPRGEVALR